jgi:serine phosphatase RsbU (regulator of sigma subunit)
MSQCFRLFHALAVLLVFGVPATSEPARLQQAPAAQSNDAISVSIGQSVVPLNGPWKFRVGDSLVNSATHRPLWAEPGFNDSEWETVDLTPKSGSTDPVSGLAGFVPGWTVKGHSGYWGYAWYRIRVKVETRPGIKLALAGPSDVDDVYQVFANGGLVGSFGKFSSDPPTVYYSQPVMFQLPQLTDRVAGESTMELAFRVWMHPSTLLQGDDVGGFHTPPLLGDSGALAAQHRMLWDELLRAYAGGLIEGVIFSLLGVVAFSLTLFDRSDRVYLWIGAVLLLVAADGYLLAIGALTQWVGGETALLMRQVITESLVFAGWVMVWRVWFRLRRPRWLPWVVGAVVPLLMVTRALGQDLFFTIVPHPVAHACGTIALALRILLAFLLLLTTFQGIRAQGLEGWVALPAVLLAGISQFYLELQVLHIQQLWFPFGVQISTHQLTDLLLAAVLAVLLLRRLVLSLRSQREMALDVKQAQEVQHVILPMARTVLPGLVVESEYHPAREVGGDFFQIIPQPTDGSLLIVAGDVTGKGLKAGMLVALLVGAIRSTAETTTEPLAVLHALNRRLLGRGDAQATCLALRIEVDGNATLANAGHMAPYMNGEAMEIEGSLPLGMMEGAEFSVTQFRLSEHDRLMLMSDGIAEATDAHGELFGFERVRELLRTASSAVEVASAAQKFGQEDDISVISVTRTEVLTPSLA